jgi:hypothetical protein
MKTQSQPNRIRVAMVLRGVLCCGLLALSAGCHSLKITEPKRTVTEQLLLSSAADRAVAELEVSTLRGKTVYVEERYFKSYDKRYVLGAIRQRLSESGARLTADEEKADVIVEPRSAGLGLDTQESLLGIPSMGLPIPLTGTVQTPEIALYKSQKGDSTAKFALFAYERTSGEHVHSAGAQSGKAHFYHYKILGFFNWRNTDIPELDPRNKSRRDRAQ